MRRLSYVHVVECATDKMVRVIGPCANADKTERGVMINLNHDEYYTRVSDCPHGQAEAVSCLECTTSSSS